MTIQEPQSPDRSEENRILVFDNNFARNLISDKFNLQLDDHTSDLRHVLRTPFTPLRTPFSFMELIGLKPSKLPTPTSFDLTSVTSAEYIPYIYTHFLNHYSALEDLTKASLNSALQQQQVHVSENFTDIWENLVHGFQDEAATEWLQFALSFDAVHKFVPLKRLKADFHSQLISAGFFNADHRIRNMSKFRLAYRMWNNSYDLVLRSANSDYLRNELQEANRLIRIGNQDDYLDCDLIHLACLGSESPDGTRHRVTCITCDSPQVIRWRLRLYKGFLAFIRSLYSDQLVDEGYPENLESSHNGEVLCFSHEGELVESINISEQIDPLLFLGGPQLAPAS